MVLGSHVGLEKGYTQEDVPRYFLNYTSGDDVSGGRLLFYIQGRLDSRLGSNQDTCFKP